MALKKWQQNAEGFTLIELLVVIAIIGILSAVILATFTTVRNKASMSRMYAEALQLSKAITISQSDSGKTLMQMTGNGCSVCVATCTATDLRNTNNTCYAQWVSDLGKIQAAADTDVQGITNFSRDPWGSPWLLDENEGEYVATPCRADTITSAGADGIRSTADDYTFTLPYSSGPCLIR